MSADLDPSKSEWKIPSPPLSVCLQSVYTSNERLGLHRGYGQAYTGREGEGWGVVGDTVSSPGSSL